MTISLIRTSRSLWRAFCAAALASAVSGACNKTGPPVSQTPYCDPGMSSTCVCPSSTRSQINYGTAQCNADGTSLGKCTGCDTTMVCMPGASSSCVCPDSSRGTATCSADGASLGTCKGCTTTSGCTPGDARPCACASGTGQQTCGVGGVYGKCLGCAAGGSAGATGADGAGGGAGTPTCGDGIVQDGEACDDGALNGQTGDGCTSECTVASDATVATCTQPQKVAVFDQPVTVMGTTTAREDQISNSCGGMGAPEAVYLVSIHKAGTLQIAVTQASFDYVIYFSDGACPSAPTGPSTGACSTATQGGPLQISGSAGDDTAIVIDGATAGVDGTFTVTFTVN